MCRRAALIAEIKQRLSSLKNHLGVNGQSRAPEAVPALKRLPKVRPTKAERILLAPKRKRNAVLDPEWEARTVEALLVRGVSNALQMMVYVSDCLPSATRGVLLPSASSQGAIGYQGLRLGGVIHKPSCQKGCLFGPV